MDSLGVNERLCDVFEMLVDRLSSIESKQDRQDLAARQEDSFSELGKPIAGARLCGRSVRLQVYDNFNPDGIFHPRFGSDHMIIVLREDDVDQATCHPHGQEAVMEEALLDRHHGLLAVGTRGVAVQDVGIGKAVCIMDAVTIELGHTLSESVFIYRIFRELKQLAIAILRESGRESAWRALSTREQRWLMKTSTNTGIFFTKDRLAACT